MTKEKQREYYQKNKERISERQKKYRRENPDFVPWIRKNKERATEIARKSRLKIKYNITLDQFNGLFEQQNCQCAVCKDDFDLSKPKDIHTDHDHTTGKVRGLLCTRCNLGLGNFRDSKKILGQAIKYLDNFN